MTENPTGWGTDYEGHIAHLVDVARIASRHDEEWVGVMRNLRRAIERAATAKIREEERGGQFRFFFADLIDPDKQEQP